jgi:hypothetical protein
MMAGGCALLGMNGFVVPELLLYVRALGDVHLCVMFYCY